MLTLRDHIHANEMANIPEKNKKRVAWSWLDSQNKTIRHPRTHPGRILPLRKQADGEDAQEAKQSRFHGKLLGDCGAGQAEADQVVAVGRVGAVVAERDTATVHDAVPIAAPEHPVRARYRTARIGLRS
jgi:hypothetical protein